MRKPRLRGSLVRLTIVGALALGMVATVAASDSKKLSTNLLGTNEVPAADPDGRGKATVRIDMEAGVLCFDISFDRAGTANRGHIHRGVAGANGPIVVPFFDIHLVPDNQRDPRHEALEGKSRLSDCVEVAPSLLAEIQANPSGFYVNLHNARFPGGMVRGQLAISGGD